MSDRDDLANVLASLQHEIVQLTNYVDAVAAKARGSWSVAAVVDEQETNRLQELQTKRLKEIYSHLYDESARYTTVVVAGAYAGLFGLESITSGIVDKRITALSTLLLVFSLIVFVLWQVGNMVLTNYQLLKGKLPNNSISFLKVFRWCWFAALLFTIVPALGAASVLGYSYVEVLLAKISAEAPPAKQKQSDQDSRFTPVTTAPRRAVTHSNTQK